MNLIHLVLVAAVLGFVYFTVRWLQLRSGYQALSRTEQRRAEMLKSREENAKVSRRQKLRAEMVRTGLGDDMFPLFAIFTVCYLATAVLLSFINVPQPLGYILTFPAMGGLSWAVVKVRAGRRRAEFNRQLQDLLNQLVAQIKAGSGAQRALGIVAPQMTEPMRGEMLQALAKADAGVDLVDCIQELAVAYPSRAMTMFLTALEIDRAEGQAIAPALEQAADLLKRDFALQAELNAEISQTKYEFYAVAAIIIGLGLYLVLGGDEQSKEAYMSMGGLIAIAIASANMAFGIWRFTRKLNTLKGES